MENVKSSDRFNKRIRNKKGVGARFLFLIEKLAIIIRAEIHIVKRIKGKLKKSVENLLLKIIW